MCSGCMLLSEGNFISGCVCIGAVHGDDALCWRGGDGLCWHEGDVACWHVGDAWSEEHLKQRGELSFLLWVTMLTKWVIVVSSFLGTTTAL